VKEGLGMFDVNDLCMAFNCIDGVMQNKRLTTLPPPPVSSEENESN
jgi:hypothetical protein